jgi:hypothetical protein
VVAIVDTAMSILSSWGTKLDSSGHKAAVSSVGCFNRADHSRMASRFN